MFVSDKGNTVSAGMEGSIALRPSIQTIPYSRKTCLEQKGRYGLSYIQEIWAKKNQFQEGRGETHKKRTLNIDSNGYTRKRQNLAEQASQRKRIERNFFATPASLSLEKTPYEKRI